MVFEDWESFNGDLMVLPWNGHKYRIPEMRADMGAWFRVQGDKKIKTPLSKMTDVEQARATLGDAYDQMIADGAPDRMVARACEAAVADWLLGRAAAEIVWKDGVSDPKALTEKVVQTLLPSTAEDEETPKPDSLNSTSSPQSKRPARKSPGRRSSKTGA